LGTAQGFKVRPARSSQACDKIRAFRRYLFWQGGVLATFNVLLATELNDFNEGHESELLLRLEEACFERIPTLKYAWEIEDESDAKNDAVEKFVNVCRTYPFELKMVVHAGTGQILRRKKTFEP
jgi:hypothetical protein